MTDIEKTLASKTGVAHTYRKNMKSKSIWLNNSVLAPIQIEEITEKQNFCLFKITLFALQYSSSLVSSVVIVASWEDVLFPSDHRSIPINQFSVYSKHYHNARFTQGPCNKSLSYPMTAMGNMTLCQHIRVNIYEGHSTNKVNFSL